MNSPAAFDAINKAADLLASARHAVALTGAGISTPSGIPDFRTPQAGLWTQVDPMKVASLTAFRNQPQVFYDWLRPLARLSMQAKPNAAHLALAELEQRGRLRAVITQNIDSLHQRAGSKHVLELHGALNTLICPQCRSLCPTSDHLETFMKDGRLPVCRKCQTILKPDIVLYEEMLPVEVWTQAQHHCNRCDVLLVVGTSLEVTPAAGLPMTAYTAGACVIINTLQPTYMDDLAEVVLREDTASVLPRILQQIDRGN